MGTNRWTGRIRIILHRRSSRITAAVALILFLLWAGVQFLQTAPHIPLLIHERGAVWIRFPQQFQYSSHGPKIRSTRFRCRLEVRDMTSSARLTLQAMKQAEVFLDGQRLFRTPDDPRRWRESHQIDLKPWLSGGSHELAIEVSNVNGYPALLAHCEPLAIKTGESWEASQDDHTWLPALPVDRVSPLAISMEFPRSDQAVRAFFPLFLGIFALIFFVTLRSDNSPSPAWIRRIPSFAAAVRWLALGGWLLMGLNNFWKIPFDMGMDVTGHLHYILYIAEHGRIPLATEGWQMFQPPLYYLLTATLYKIFLGMFDAVTVVRILKLLPFLCGMLQVEIVYRTLRNAYPREETPQVVGTVLGGLLPMNLYMSQSLGNEPLAGILTALLVWLACRIFSGASAVNRETAILMGFVLGLALMTKVTALLIVPPILFFVSAEVLAGEGPLGKDFRSVGRFAILFLGTAVIVVGWYYFRNWSEMGRFFVGGWDAFRGIVWWQDPGYRTLRQCYQFGAALWRPIFSSIYGFWDAIYSSFWADGYLSSCNRPPWNYGFMLSGVWLSLLPSTFILTGLVGAVREKIGPLGRMLRFSVCCIVLYIGAVFYLWLTIPFFSSAKATYLLGLIPCFALVGAAGFQVLTRRRLLRAVVQGLFACWAVSSYLSYLVR